MSRSPLPNTILAASIVWIAAHRILAVRNPGASRILLTKRVGPAHALQTVTTIPRAKTYLPRRPPSRGLTLKVSLWAYGALRSANQPGL
jgi:hypothetical protein